MKNKQKLNRNRRLSSGADAGGGVGGGTGGRSNYLHDLVKDGKPTCSLCNKSFHTLQSLFGHMRCHPERKWRTSSALTHERSAPDHDQIDSSSVCIANGMTTSSPVSLLQHLFGWSTKARRGRRRNSSRASSSAPMDNHHHAQLGSRNSKNYGFTDDSSCMKSRTMRKKRKRKTVKLKDLNSSNQILIRNISQVLVKDGSFGTSNHDQELGEGGGEAEAEAPPSSSSSSPAEQQLPMFCDDNSGSAATADTKNAIFDFDLNELPADDPEKEGYGY